MKRISIVLCGVALLGVATWPVSAEDAMASQVSARLSKAASLSMSEVKANQIMKGKVVYSGLAVAAIKKDNPLQLFNPFAPVTYGSANDITLHDPSIAGTGSARAWKLFSVHF